MGTRLTWQIASASASAAWSDTGGLSSPSSAATIRCTCSLPARPLPHTASFTACGVYAKHGTPTAPAAASTAPRAWPTAKAVRTLRPKKMSSTASAAGRCAAISSPSRAEIAASRTSSAWSGVVEMTPPLRADSSLPHRSTRPKPVDAVPGSMPRTTVPGLARVGLVDASIRVFFCIRHELPADRGRTQSLALLHPAEAKPHEAHHHRDQLGHIALAIAQPPVAECIEPAHDHLRELLQVAALQAHARLGRLHLHQPDHRCDRAAAQRGLLLRDLRVGHVADEHLECLWLLGDEREAGHR